MAALKAARLGEGATTAVRSERVSSLSIAGSRAELEGNDPPWMLCRLLAFDDEGMLDPVGRVRPWMFSPLGGATEVEVDRFVEEVGVIGGTAIFILG
jgi:hypothetical protein